eukprot:3003572-Ditylum_brightwellii.AAC.1
MPFNSIDLFFDNIQWTDIYLLHLIKSLVTDTKIENCHFIQCYHDDEVDNTHPLIANLHGIELKSVAVTKI